MSHSRDDDHRCSLRQQHVCSFQEMKPGEEFFDPASGDFFEKVSDTHGRCISGGDAFEVGLAPFDADERVVRATDQLTDQAGGALALRTDLPRDSDGTGLSADAGGRQQYRGERG